MGKTAKTVGFWMAMSSAVVMMLLHLSLYSRKVYQIHIDSMFVAMWVLSTIALIGIYLLRKK